MSALINKRVVASGMEGEVVAVAYDEQHTGFAALIETDDGRLVTVSLDGALVVRGGDGS